MARTQDKPGARYEQDVELDARLVVAAMRGGMIGFMGEALRLGMPDTATATGRGDWLKRQPKAYVKAVTDRAVEIERGL